MRKLTGRGSGCSGCHSQDLGLLGGLGALELPGTSDLNDAIQDTLMIGGGAYSVVLGGYMLGQTELGGKINDKLFTSVEPASVVASSAAIVGSSVLLNAFLAKNFGDDEQEYVRKIGGGIAAGLFSLGIVRLLMGLSGKATFGA